MKKRFIASWVVVLLLAPFAWAVSNLDLSKSNVNRLLLVHPTELVTAANAKKMLRTLDKLGPLDEAKLKQWLEANLQRYEIDGSRVKKVVVIKAPGDKVTETTIILLTDPEDQARATTFAKAPATTVKSSKSNSQE